MTEKKEENERRFKGKGFLSDKENNVLIEEIENL